MLLKDALEQKLMDVRLLDKHLADGKISRKEYEEYLSALSDDASHLATSGSPSGSAGSDSTEASSMSDAGQTPEGQNF